MKKYYVLTCVNEEKYVVSAHVFDDRDAARKKMTEDWESEKRVFDEEHEDEYDYERPDDYRPDECSLVYESCDGEADDCYYWQITESIME